MEQHKQMGSEMGLLCIQLPVMIWFHSFIPSFKEHSLGTSSVPGTVKTQAKNIALTRGFQCRNQGKTKFTIQGNCSETGQLGVLQEKPGALNPG